MDLVLLTSLGVGGATVIGALIGFVFKGLTHKLSDIVLSFAAGVMLAAAVFGLIIPSIEYGGKWGLLITILGIFKLLATELALSTKISEKFTINTNPINNNKYSIYINLLLS